MIFLFVDLLVVVPLSFFRRVKVNNVECLVDVNEPFVAVVEVRAQTTRISRRRDHSSICVGMIQTLPSRCGPWWGESEATHPLSGQWNLRRYRGQMRVRRGKAA